MELLWPAENFGWILKVNDLIKPTWNIVANYIVIVWQSKTIFLYTDVDDVRDDTVKAQSDAQTVLRNLYNIVSMEILPV